MPAIQRLRNLDSQYAGAISMDLPESDLHSFIIKLRLKEGTEGAARGGWRGQIKHVPSGEHRHIKSFDEIKDFISSYLRSKGVEPAPRVGFWKRIGRMRLRS